MHALARAALYALYALLSAATIFMVARVYLEHTRVPSTAPMATEAPATTPKLRRKSPAGEDDWVAAEEGGGESVGHLVVFTDAAAAKTWSGDGAPVVFSPSERQPLLAAAARCGSSRVVAHLPHVTLGVPAAKLAPRRGAVFCDLPGELYDSARRPDRYGDRRYSGAFVAMHRDSCRRAVAAARGGAALEDAFEGLAQCREVESVLGVVGPAFQGTHLVYDGGAVVRRVDPSSDEVPTHSMRGGEPDPMAFYQVPGADARPITK